MFEVVGFYKFVKISYLKKNQKVLLETLKKKNIRGTIIISKEGVNGTISGKTADIKFFNIFSKFISSVFINNFSIPQNIIDDY